MNKFKKQKTTLVSLHIVGLILSESYQHCKIFAEKLFKHHSNAFSAPTVKGYLEMDWVEYQERLRKEVAGQAWALRGGVAVSVDGSFLGGKDELFAHFHSYSYSLPASETVRQLAKQEYLEYLNRNNLLYTYLQLSLGGEYMGTLLFQLRADLLPRTASWFALLCDPHNRLGYSYRGSAVHRVCRSGWFQAGQLKNPQDSDGFLNDESFCYKHDRRGILSFANDGKNKSKHEFFVTFKPSQWMDGYYVAFGRLVEGADVLRRIENIECTYESPVREIKITDCGLAEVGLGRSLTDKSRMRGLTVGEPHIQLETFADLVYERFCDALFSRLDAEVQARPHGEWVAAALWERVQERLLARRPPQDTEDPQDRTSYMLLAARYLAGLYGLKEIPDHFILELIDRAVDDAVERSDAAAQAGSVVSFVLDTRLSQGSDPEAVVERLLDLLLSRIVSESHLSQEKLLRGKHSTSTKIIKSVSWDVQMQSRSDVQRRVRFTKSGSGVTGAESLPQEPLSTKASVVGYILDTLLNTTKSVTIQQ